MPGALMNMADFDRTTTIVLDPQHDPVGMSVNDVLKWIEPNAPPGEALKFLLVCRSFGLNPFASEAYLMQIGGKWATIVGKYGYLKRAQRHPDYNGFEAGLVVQEMMTDPRTGNPQPGRMKGLPIEVEGNILPYGYLLVGGWAKVWRRGVDRPVKTRVSLTEYDKGSATWKSIKCTMIAKVALVHAIREAFAFGDAYDESEFEPVERRRPTSDGRPGPMPIVATVQATTGAAGALCGPMGSIGGETEVESLYAGNPDPICPPDLVREIDDLRIRLGKDPRWLDGILMRAGYASVTALTPNAASELIVKLQGFASRIDLVESFPHGAGEHRPTAAHGGSMPLDAEIVGVGEGGADGADGVRPGYSALPVGSLDDGEDGGSDSMDTAVSAIAASAIAVSLDSQ